MTNGFIVLWSSRDVKTGKKVPHSRVFGALDRAEKFARQTADKGCLAVSLRSVELREGIHFVGSEKLPFEGRP